MSRLASGGSGATVEFLLEQMEPESGRCLRLCAIPHQFDSQILQVLEPGLTREHADKLCDEFAGLPVVTFNPDGMALHDEAREQLFQQWIGPPGDATFTAASKRLEAYFANKAKTATDANTLDVFDTAQMFHLLGANQEAGFQRFQDMCRRKRHQFRLDDCEHLISLTHEYDSVLLPRHQLWLAYHEGKLAADRCDWKIAEEIFQRILSTQPLDPELAIRATNRLGMILDEKRDYPGAIDHYQKALKLAESTAVGKAFVHRLLTDLGTAQRDSGQIEEAEKVLTRSIELAKGYDDQSAIAVAYNSLGTLYRKKQEPWEAISAYQKSLDYLLKSNDSLRPAQVYNNLGVVYRELGKWKESKDFFEKSRVISAQVGDSNGEAKTLNNLTVVYGNLKQNNNAVESAQRAAKLFEELHDTYNAALAKRNLGRLYRRMKEHDKAAEAFNEAINSFEHCKAIGEVAETRGDIKRLQNRRSGVVFWIIAISIILGVIILVGLLIVYL